MKLEYYDSIDSAPGYQPANYKGFRSPFVWMDSRFATPALALQSALRLYSWLRQPAITARFTCWAQPDLYPMDLIQVSDWRTGLQNLPLTIMSMNTTMGVTDEGPRCMSQIVARYLDPIALQAY